MFSILAPKVSFFRNSQTHLAITAYHFRRRHIVVPTNSLGNRIPLRHSALKCDAHQTGAAIEGIAANACNTSWNGDARQTVAVREGIVANFGHTTRNGDTRQTGAAIEGTVANAGHATIGRYGAILAADNQCFSGGFNDAVATAVINRISGFHCDTGQTGAALESRCTNAGHTIRNGDARQTGAALEGIAVNACHTIRNGDARQTGAAIEGIPANAGYTIRDGDARQAAAT